MVFIAVVKCDSRWRLFAILSFKYRRPMKEKRDFWLCNNTRYTLHWDAVFRLKTASTSAEIAFYRNSSVVIRRFHSRSVSCLYYFYIRVSSFICCEIVKDSPFFECIISFDWTSDESSGLVLRACAHLGLPEIPQFPLSSSVSLGNSPSLPREANPNTIFIWKTWKWCSRRERDVFAGRYFSST